MSLGFLTESALIPRKSKKINVDPSTVVGLKAFIAEKERLQDQQDDKITFRKRTRKVTNPKPKDPHMHNPGVEERIRKDEEELKAQSSKKRIQVLEQKAEKFHAMQRGDIEVDDENSLVDFKRRKQMYEFYNLELPENEQPSKHIPSKDKNSDDFVLERYREMMKMPHNEDEVLIEDEFGRVRWAKRGSDDYMNNIGSSYRIKQQLEGKHQYDPEKIVKTSRAARVKMTWENQLNKDERDYFTEIDRETEMMKKVKQNEKKKPIPQAPVRSKEEVAEDMLRALL